MRGNTIGQGTAGNGFNKINSDPLDSVRGDLGIVTAVISEGQMALNRLDKCVDILSQKIIEMNNKFEPVMKPSVDNYEEKTGINAQTHSLVTHKINEVCDKIERIGDGIDFLCQRVDF